METQQPSPLKIAIFGPLCSGKSTLANYIHYSLESRYYQKAERVSFGKMIYEIANTLFDMKIKDRKLLQDIGRKLRDIDEDVFTKYTMRYCDRVQSPIIIEDARLTSEFNALIEHTFILIYLEISSEKQMERIRRTYPDTYEKHIENLQHSSELELKKLPKDKFHYVINMDVDEIHVNSMIDTFLDQCMHKNA